MKWLIFALFSFSNPYLEQATTYYQEEAYNKTIETLLNNPSDSFQENILMGSSLVMLQQYPLAVYYYLSALKKDPNNVQIRSMMKETIALGDLSTEIPSPLAFGPPQWLLGSIVLMIFLSISLWLKIRSHFLRKLTLMSAFLFLMSFFVLLVFSFQSPIFGVMIRTNFPFQEPLKGPQMGFQIPNGSIVTVLDVVEKGAWIKVRTSNGLMGYVPESAIRIVI